MFLLFNNYSGEEGEGVANTSNPQIRYCLCITVIIINYNIIVNIIFYFVIK